MIWYPCATISFSVCRAVLRSNFLGGAGSMSGMATLPAGEAARVLSQQKTVPWPGAEWLRAAGA